RKSPAIVVREVSEGLQFFEGRPAVMADKYRRGQGSDIDFAGAGRMDGHRENLTVGQAACRQELPALAIVEAAEDVGHGDRVEVLGIERIQPYLAEVFAFPCFVYDDRPFVR